MIFNVYRINFEEISDLKPKKLAQQQYSKFFILSCEHGHLKIMIIWEDEPNPDLLSVQNVVLLIQKKGSQASGLVLNSQEDLRIKININVIG